MARTIAVYPGAVLLDEFEERGITQSALAIHIGVLPKTVNEICRGKRGISAEILGQGATRHKHGARTGGIPQIRQDLQCHLLQDHLFRDQWSAATGPRRVGRNGQPDQMAWWGATGPSALPSVLRISPLPPLPPVQTVWFAPGFLRRRS